MHWRCYAGWPSQPEFAWHHFRFRIGVEERNPAWGRALVTSWLYVDANPRIQEVGLWLAATGGHHHVRFDAWQSWLEAAAADGGLHPLQRSALLAALPLLRERLPDTGVLLRALDHEEQRGGSAEWVVPPERQAIFRHCTRCASRVPPYPASRVALHDLYEYGAEPPGLEEEPHYWCADCGERRLAPNEQDTGSCCALCGAFMPIAHAFCGACGAPMRSGETWLSPPRAVAAQEITVFRYCYACGVDVEPYGRRRSQSDPAPTYSCPDCERDWPAPASEDTASLCTSCGDWVPLYSRCCPSCGARTGFERQ